MKKIILAAALALIHGTALAAVNLPHAMNVLKGTYSFKDRNSGNRVEFTVDAKGAISLQENDAYVAGKATVATLTNGLADGLPVLTVILAGGSDEQNYNLIVRLAPIQDTRTEARLLDVVFTENDGPNQVTHAEIQADVSLAKMNKEGKWVELKRVLRTHPKPVRRPPGRHFTNPR